MQLLQGEAEALPFADASFDALTFTYLLRYVDDPRATVRELARVLRPGGRVASLEFGVPPWAPARAAWRLYTAVGLPVLGRSPRASGRGGALPRAEHPRLLRAPPARDDRRLLAAAGLRDVRVRRMSLGGGIVMSAVKGDGADGRAAGER